MLWRRTCNGWHMMTAAPHRTSQRRSYKRFIYLTIIVIACYVIVPQLSIFKHSLGLVERARPDYVVAAFGCNLASYLVAALTYYLLAFKAIRYRPTVLVQVASMFTNRLLPAGLGGMGANYFYLRRSRHAPSQALCVVGVNNLLGFVGHLALLSGLLLVVPAARRIPVPHISTMALVGLALVVVGVVVGLALATKLRHKVIDGLSAIARNLRLYRRQPGHLLAAFGSSLSLSVTNLVCLWLCALAVGIHIGLVQILLVFTFGVALGSVSPTPGGIGGVEAGLVTGLIAYQVPANQALAAVLIFRLINYWFSLLLGAGAFVVAERRGFLALA
jgi:uncharacterized membrane protein YbhN (UPF0104 family)